MKEEKIYRVYVTNNGGTTTYLVSGDSKKDVIKLITDFYYRTGKIYNPKIFKVVAIRCIYCCGEYIEIRGE